MGKVGAAGPVRLVVGSDLSEVRHVGATDGVSLPVDARGCCAPRRATGLLPLRGCACTVRDESTALPSRRVAYPMDLSGRGLEIVDMVSLDWGIKEDEHGSKVVWASFAIRRSREL